MEFRDALLSLLLFLLSLVIVASLIYLNFFDSSLDVLGVRPI